MTWPFIHRHRTTQPATVRCRVFRVSRGAYDGWLRRPPWFLRCQGKTVEMLPCPAGRAAKICRRFRVTTADSRHIQPIAAKRLGRKFQPAAEYAALARDVTRVPAGDGWFDLARVEDLYLRAIVGGSTWGRIDCEWVAGAHDPAIQRQRPQPGLLAHPDQDLQAGRDRFQQRSAESGICGVRRETSCWGNAPSELPRSRKNGFIRQPARVMLSGERCSKTSQCFTIAHGITPCLRTERQTPPMTSTPQLRCSERRLGAERPRLLQSQRNRQSPDAIRRQPGAATPINLPNV